MSQDWSELIRGRVHLYSKNLMSVEDTREYFRDYLLERIRAFSRFCYPYAGVINFCGITSQLPQKVSILSGVGIDNNGNVLYWQDYQNLEIPDIPELHYAIKYSELAGDIELNVKTGLPAYAKLYEVLGDVGVADSVTDNYDGTLTLDVSTILRGVPSTNRMVRVMLVDPKSLTNWYVDTLVSDDTKVTIPHYLGQVVPSLNGEDYIVWVLGVSLATDRDSFSEEYIYLGKTTQTSETIPVWGKTGIRWLQGVHAHHTANLPNEIKYPHKLETLDKYYYPQNNLLYNSYFFSGSAPTLNGWTLSKTGGSADISVDSTYGDFGYTCIKFVSDPTTACTGTILANTTTNNNFIKVGKGVDLSFQVKCNLLSGSMSSNAGVSIKIKVYERDGSTLIEDVLLCKERILVNGNWALIYYNGWRNTYNRSVVICPYVLIETNTDDNITLLVSSIKAEFGSSITIYTPHPSEVNGAFGTGTSSTITTSTTSTTTTVTTSRSWSTTDPICTTLSTSGTWTSPATTPLSTSETQTEPPTGTATEATPPPSTTSSGGGGGCITGDSLIRMADGSEKPITNIIVGDKVITFDSNGVRGVGTVSKVYRHKGRYKVKDLNVCGNLLSITEDHKISVQVEGKIGYKAVSGVVKSSNKVYCPLTKEWGVVKVVGEHYVDEVFNFTVAPLHCYIANNILISNMKMDDPNPTYL